ncbi:Conserved_hypothetical protein [Hexamita inflata]|uniref:Uncharacterized protein n=1 Tax=Hexamita inflata TaxID=28002 RepID=A0AA86Q3V6_9EUKA|nr:Conserved hypothetical protein [Hexamita inflata]CAI9959434.1 Conserved hypothetical protein [Hexamita inflata]
MSSLKNKQPKPLGIHVKTIDIDEIHCDQMIKTPKQLTNPFFSKTVKQLANDAFVNQLIDDESTDE